MSFKTKCLDGSKNLSKEDFLIIYGCCEGDLEQMIKIIFEVTGKDYDQNYIRNKCKKLCLSLKGEEYDISKEKSNEIENKYFERFCEPINIPSITGYKKVNR